MEGSDLNLALVERALLEDPHSFGFFAAVRALERLHAERAPVGHDSDPASEVVRFGVPAALAFPASEIQALDVPDDEPARMTVNFMGLTGPSGVLPYVYTQYLIERVRENDRSAVEFLNVFHHRIISLFYRAWEKHQFTVQYEKSGADPLTTHLLDLGGLRADGDAGTGAIRTHAFAFYAGLLAPQQRSAVALEQLVSDFFDVPARVEQFIGGWYEVDRPDQCALDEPDEASRLGRGALIGDEVFDTQARARIRIGPLEKARYEAFLPGGSAHEALRSTVRLFCHDQFDFEIQLVLAREDVPGVTLGEGEEERLGWTTWMRTRERDTHADETVLSL